MTKKVPDDRNTCPTWCGGDYDDHDGVAVTGHESAHRTVEWLDSPTAAAVTGLLFADETTNGPMVLLGVLNNGHYASVDVPLPQIREVIDMLAGLLVDAAGVTS